MSTDSPAQTESADPPRPVENALGNRRADVVIVTAMAVVYAFSFFQRVAVPGTVFDELQRAFSLSSASVALLGGTYLYIYSAMQLPAGALIDRFGGVRVILAGGALLAAGAVLFPLSRSVAALFAARALVGLGASAAYLCVVKEVDRRFSDRWFPAILGIVGFTASVGGLMGTFPLQRAMESYGWRTSLLAVGIATGFAVVLVAALSRTVRTTSTPPPTDAPRVIGRVIRNRSSMPAIAASSIIFGSYFVVQTVIGKKLMTDCFGMSPSGAAGCTFAMMVTTICCVIIVGYVPSLIGGRRRPIQVAGGILASVATGCAVLCLTLGAGATAMIACYMLMAMASTTNIMFVCSVKELNSPETPATSIGVMNTACYLGIATIVTLVGIILDQFSPQTAAGAALTYPPQAYRAVFAVLFVLSLASLALTLRIKETRGRNRWHELRDLMS